MDLTNHFGINVEKRFKNWFHGEFADYFEARFPDQTMTLVILDPDRVVSSSLAWDKPEKHMMLALYQGPKRHHAKPGGTLENVYGKLRFALRTIDDSIQSELAIEDDRLRPGDFPWEGAGWYYACIGGVSGLSKEEDWEMFCLCVDKLMELLSAAGRAARAKREKQHNDPKGKYLHVTISKKKFRAALKEVVAEHADSSVAARMQATLDEITMLVEVYIDEITVEVSESDDGADPVPESGDLTREPGPDAGAEDDHPELEPGYSEGDLDRLDPDI